MEVREGQAITMFSPRPCWFLAMRFFSPSPKATSNETDTVPQVMPNRVSSVRTFWCRTSCSICRRKETEVNSPTPLNAEHAETAERVKQQIRQDRFLCDLCDLSVQSPWALLDLLRRALDHQVVLLEALGHLDVHAVRE